MWHLAIFLSVITAIRCNYTYETKWFEVPLDHFSFQRNETFKIKYLENNDHWEHRGPIFFYTGNEGQIENFAKHTGFMWDIAPEFKARIIFAEHRYYGQSMPFGNKSLNNDHIGYLSSSQAMADYADLINYLQADGNRPRYPVIAFGGSYGGMLAAYMRIKYPHLVDGAISASAPIHMYPGMIPCEVFNRIATSSFKLASESCVQNIRQSWSLLRNFMKLSNNTDWLQKTWKLCDPIKGSEDIEKLVYFLTSMYTTLAMVNYPFPSDFLMPLPAEPVRVVCQYLNGTLNSTEILVGIGKILDTYVNYDGKSKCVNYKDGDTYGNLDTNGWNYQSCTEMVMPICANGKDDMFEPMPWNFTKFSNDCFKTYNVRPHEYLAKTEYGGDRLKAATNIVFSNGLLDPWAGGGILSSISQSVKTVIIIDGAHHLDLMPRNDNDPVSVKVARNIHKQNIEKWIKEFEEEQESQL